MTLRSDRCILHIVHFKVQSILRPRRDNGMQKPTLQVLGLLIFHPTHSRCTMRATDNQSKARAGRSESLGGQQPVRATATINLPSLPRYHPAKFPRQEFHMTTTRALISHDPCHIDAPFLSYHHKRELPRSPVRGPVATPTTPRLLPVNSPGSVTPLELDSVEGYLHTVLSPAPAGYHCNALIGENEALRRDIRPLVGADVGEGPGRSMHAASIHYSRSESQDCQIRYATGQ